MMTRKRMALAMALLFSFSFSVAFGLSNETNICSYVAQISRQYKVYFYGGCGLWGWGRCQKSSLKTAYSTALHYRCCEGWYHANQHDTDCKIAQCMDYAAGTCPNGGTCVEPDICSCRIGYQNPDCADIDECEGDSKTCSQLCENTHGSFLCTCVDGYVLGSDGSTCSAACFDEAPGECPNGGTCLSPGLCQCSDGFGGESCSDINECLDFNGGCDQLCENVPGSYRCQCEPGFHLQEDLTTCKDFDLHACSLGDTFTSCPRCTKLFWGECSCPQGLFLHNDNERCVPACFYGMCLNGGRCEKIEAQGLVPTGNVTDVTDVPVILGFDCDCNGTDSTGKYCQDRVTTTTEAPTTLLPTTEETTTTEAYFTDVSEDDIDLTIQTTTVSSELEDDWIDFDENATLESLRIKETLRNCGFHAKPGNMTSVRIRVPDAIELTEKGNSSYLEYKTELTEAETLYICVDDNIEVVPKEIYVDPSNLTGKIEIRGLSGGLYLLLFMHPNSEEPLAKVDVRIVDIYTQIGLDVGEIPVGDFHLDFSFHSTALKFASTSEWCVSASEGNVHFTRGMVYSVAGDVSLPISESGLEVAITGNKLITGPVSRHRSFESCQRASSSRSKREMSYLEQITRHLTDKEEELISRQSVLDTLFSRLEDKLPSWMRLYVNKKVPDATMATVQILTGFYAQRLSPCFGAPLHEDRLYHVYRFPQSYSIYLMGAKEDLPSLKEGEGEYCVIVDLNKDQGATVFMKYPGQSAKVLASSFIPVDENVGVLRDFNFIPTAIAVSFPAGLNGHRRTLSELSSITDPLYFKTTEFIGSSTDSVTLWNGDTMFSYPVSKEVSVYTTFHLSYSPTGAKWFQIKTDMELFMSMPDLTKTFQHFTDDPWEAIFQSTKGFSLIIRFPLGGKMQEIDLNNISPNLLSIQTQGLGSYGGSDDREFCGGSANPPGIFLEANINAKLFRGVPFLEKKIEELTFSSADLKVQFFRMPDDYRLTKADLTKYNLILQSLDRYAAQAEKVLTERTKEAEKDALELVKEDLEKARSTVAEVRVHAQRLYENLKNGVVADSNDLILKKASELYDNLESMLQKSERKFYVNFSSLVKQALNQITEIRNKVTGFFVTVLDSIISNINGPGTWGIKGRFSIVILGDLYAIEGYVVKADTHVSRCGFFSQFFDHLKGQKAIRVWGKVEFPIMILPKVKIDVGFGIEFAVALAGTNFVLRLHASAKFLGITAQTDLFINNKGLHSVYQTNIYNIFRSRVTLSANVFVPVSEWYVLLRVELLPGGDGFEGSFLDVLKNYVKNIAQDAFKQLHAAQESLESAKQSVRKAQTVITKAKGALDGAKVHFDKAVIVLENAKSKLEAAKEPFKRALAALDKAKYRVQNMCTIQECESLCIPGLKARLCWAGWFPYPCIEWTNCMIRIPNPICVLKNAGCYIVRGLAYAALAIAKVAIHIPMLVLDAAKLALSVAQVAVKVGKVALDVAKVAMDVAVIALDQVVVILNVAKTALEVVKIAVRLGFKVFEFIIEYGLKKLFDIKVCGFEFVVSTKDVFEFEIFCNINPFGLGWRNVGFRINFNNLWSSLWNAAKAVASQFMGLLKNAFGRRKREIDHEMLARLHHIIRGKRETSFAGNMSSENLFGKYFENGTILTDISWEQGTQFWEERCEEFTPIYKFLLVTMETIFNASKTVNEELETALNATSHDVFEDIDEENDALFEDEIDFDIAMTDFNISKEELMAAIKEANVSNDDLYQKTKNASVEMKRLNLQSAEIVSSYDLLTRWKAELVNISKVHFSEDECYGYSDCFVWSFIQLYTLFSSVESRLIPNSNSSLIELETLIYDLLDNSSKTVSEVKNASEHALFLLAELDFDSVFCGEAPTITEHPVSQTVILGSSGNLSCKADAVPEVDYFWYKDDEFYVSGSSVLLFTETTMEDEGKYTCVTGNHILNVSSNEASLTVVQPPEVTPLPSYLEFLTGDHISIECVTSSKPKANVLWTSTSRDMNRITNETIGGLANDTVSAGLYVCTGYNEYGYMVSNEVLVDIKPSQPACPSVEMDIGLVMEPSDINPPNKTEFLYLTILSLRSVLTQASSSLELLMLESNENLVKVEVRLNCTNISSCTMHECQDVYNSLKAELTSAVSLLTDAALREEILFKTDQQAVFFSRGLIHAGLIIPRCPEQFLLKFDVLCVYKDQVYRIPPPVALELVDKGDNLTISWAFSTFLKPFLQGFAVMIQSKSEGWSEVVVNTTSIDPFLTINKTKLSEYLSSDLEVFVQVLTASQRSRWVSRKIFPTAEQQEQLASALESTMTFAIAMGVLFTVLFIVIILAAIYHVRGSNVTSIEVSDSPPPAYSESHLLRELSKTSAPKTAWAAKAGSAIEN